MCRSVELRCEPRMRARGPCLVANRGSSAPSWAADTGLNSRLSRTRYSFIEKGVTRVDHLIRTSISACKDRREPRVLSPYNRRKAGFRDRSDCFLNSRTKHNRLSGYKTNARKIFFHQYRVFALTYRFFMTKRSR